MARCRFSQKTNEWIFFLLWMYIMPKNQKPKTSICLWFYLTFTWYRVKMYLSYIIIVLLQKWIHSIVFLALFLTLASFLTWCPRSIDTHGKKDSLIPSVQLPWPPHWVQTISEGPFLFFVYDWFSLDISEMFIKVAKSHIWDSIFVPSLKKSSKLLSTLR